MPPKTPSAQPPSQPTTAEEKAPPKKAPPKKATGKKAPAAKAAGEGKKKKRSAKVGLVQFPFPARETWTLDFPDSRLIRIFRIVQHIESYKVYLYKVLKQVGLPRIHLQTCIAAQQGISGSLMSLITDSWLVGYSFSSACA